MNYNDPTYNAAVHSAKFRQEGACENKNGQNVVSHTSLLEQGRGAKSVRAYADFMSGEMPKSDKD